MERIEKTVFISYRRTNVPWALAIFQDLTHHGFDVFFDYSGIDSGHFESVILSNIAARAHFVVVLTPSALERCGHPSDWLRREIEAALESRRNIVPLMLEEFDFGSQAISSQLVGKLAKLRQYNGIRVVPDYFFEGMERLRTRFLNVPLAAVLHAASDSAQEAAAEQRAAADAAPTVQKEDLAAQKWFERGFASNDHDEEVRSYTAAIGFKNDYRDAFNNRGFALYYKGEFEEALADFDEAIRIKPDFAEAFNNRGSTRDDKGDLDGALEDFNEAIRIRPDYINAFYNRARVHGQRSNFACAIADYQTYLDLGGGKRDGDEAEVEKKIHELREGPGAGVIESLQS
jgi:tetratricopeptide (TPR) repeat protein